MDEHADGHVHPITKIDLTEDSDDTTAIRMFCRMFERWPWSNREHGANG